MAEPEPIKVLLIHLGGVITRRAKFAACSLERFVDTINHGQRESQIASFWIPS